MAVELATAYVSIIPSTKGIKGQLQSQMEGPVSDAGERSGSRFGSAMTGMAGKALKVGAGAVVAGFGAALVKGFGRLQAIDDARFKLKGLGHDAAAVDTIMESALKSVKGTAFGLGDAATIAASAVAAGVKPGEDLTRTLSLTGDAASIAGVSLSEMGAIFGKVGASNRMMTEEMNQLQDRGLPILSWLQEEYGVTADKAREMVSKGKVDFETFQRIIETNIGGAALTAGESFRGAFANMGAALGRFGAAILGPAFGSAPALFGRITDGLDVLTNRAAPFADAFGKWIPEAFETAKAVIGPVIETITSAVRGLFDLFVLGDFTGALRDAFGWEEDFPIVGALFDLRDTVISVVTTAVEWIKGFGKANSENGAWLGQTWTTIRDIFKSALDAVTAIVIFATDIIRDLWNRFGTHILSFISETWNRVKQVIDGVLKVIKGIFEVFAGAFTGDWSRVWEGIKTILSGVWNIIKAVVAQAFENIKLILGAGLAAISAMWSAAWDRMKMAFAAMWQGLQAKMAESKEELLSKVRGLKDAIVSFFSGAGRWLWDAGKNIIKGLIDGIASMVGAVARKMDSVVKSITDRLPWSPAKAGPLRSHPPEEGGRNIVTAMAAGMGSGLSTLTAAANAAAMAALPTVGTVGAFSTPSPQLAGDVGALSLQEQARVLGHAFERVLQQERRAS